MITHYQKQNKNIFRSNDKSKLFMCKKEKTQLATFSIKKLNVNKLLMFPIVRCFYGSQTLHMFQFKGTKLCWRVLRAKNSPFGRCLGS